MNIAIEKIDYLTKMKQHQEELLSFLDDEENLDFGPIFNNIDQKNIKDNPKILKEYLHLLSCISNNHRRIPHFIEKIEKIITYLKDSIKQSFSNFNIFNIFKNNKRILLFLIEERIINIDKYISLIITNSNFENAHYYEYFLPELISFLKSEPVKITEKFSESFFENRKIGENDNYLARLIQNDSVEEFVSFVSQTNIPLSTKIEHSIFETNPFLLKNSPTLIEYSAFFGSIQIFQYLYINDVRLTPSLWPYVIHGKNSDMIHFLEEKNVKPYEESSDNKNYIRCYIEAIKCHHNDIVDYLETNIIQDNPSKYKDIVVKIIKHFNFCYFKHVISNNLLFYYILINDYPALVEIFLKTSDIDINMRYILKHIFWFYLIPINYMFNCIQIIDFESNSNICF